MKLLNKYVRDKVASHWYYFGLELLEDEYIEQLDIIEKNHPGDVQRCCIEMFKYWLQIDTEATWIKLTDSLEVIGKKVLAEKVKDVLKSMLIFKYFQLRAYSYNYKYTLFFTTKLIFS